MKTATIATLFLATVSPAAFAQQSSSAPASASSARSHPVARVYVSSVTSQNSVQIDGYTAGANGRLATVPGSPFAESGSILAANQKFLFSTDGIDIYSFSIASDGALTQVSSINAQALNGYALGGPVTLTLDRTSSTLYDLDYYGNEEANNTYQFFDVDKSTGALSYLGATSAATPNFETPISFVGNNQDAYGAGCYHGDQALYGFSRSVTGMLDDLNLNPPFPVAKDGAYCPGLAISDGRNNLAVTLSPNDDMTPTGPTQLASYTVTKSGNLTTSSTWENMPTPAVVNVYSMSISPSGELLAVGGTAGLQVFHFNGPSPITPYTGLLTTDSISQVAWDDDHHLYAISQASGELFVFTVTTSTYEQSPGSPYTIASPQGIVVLPGTAGVFGY